MTKTEVESLNRAELRAAAKKAGIKYGKMSLMQVREALFFLKPTKVVEKTKKKDGSARDGSKMALAIAIFQKSPNAVRKDVIAKFISEAGLTKAGSSTYFQLIKKKLAK